MKKLVFILVAFFIGQSLVGQVSFGPKIGYSSSRLSTDLDDITESIKHNFQIGAFVRVGKKLYVQPEAYYATGGGKLQLKGTELKEEIKLKSISVPVLIGYKLINAKIFNLRVMTGPTANFIINKEIESSDLIQDPLLDSNLKNVAWGWDFGVGADVFFLTLDLRYELGLNNLYLPPSGGDDQSMKSNLFIVSLGFKLL